MYNNVLGVVEMRGNGALYDVFSDISEICDDIIVLDHDNVITESDKRLLSIFNVQILDSKINEVEYDSFSPEWVYASYSDERPSRRFRYMKISLCMHPVINTWLSKLRYLWNEEYQYRVDKGWGSLEIPMLYRYMYEVDYKWDYDLVPYNQPGPKENCMLDLYSYHFLTEESRCEVYDKYLNSQEAYPKELKRHYESFFDSEITVQQAVD